MIQTHKQKTLEQQKILRIQDQEAQPLLLAMLQNQQNLVQQQQSMHEKQDLQHQSKLATKQTEYLQKNHQTYQQMLLIK